MKKNFWVYNNYETTMDEITMIYLKYKGSNKNGCSKYGNT